MRARYLLIRRMGCTVPDAHEIEPRVWMCSWCGEEAQDCECKTDETGCPA